MLHRNDTYLAKNERETVLIPKLRLKETKRVCPLVLLLCCLLAGPSTYGR